MKPPAGEASKDRLGARRSIALKLCAQKQERIEGSQRAETT
jgi:hypothetical protein